MHSSIATFLSVAGLLASAANAHMILKTPKPYGSPNSSPLDASGSDFPCKGAAPDGTSTDMMVGQQYPLSFTGSAVHGGGSCQVSLAYGAAPGKGQNPFKVILSIEGGCPASTSGNLPADPNGSGASTFQFKIPDDAPSGEATLAWTWFNKIGNREMYMNCASVKISGGKAKRDVADEGNSTLVERADALAGYPTMFTANIGNGCTTKESVDLVFPGIESDTKMTPLQKSPNGVFGPPVGNCAAAAVGGSGGSGGSSPASMSTPAAASPTMAATSTQPKAFFESTTMATMPSPVMSSSPVAAMPSSTMPAAAMPSAGSGSTGPTAQGAACTSEGMWNCLPGGKSYQQCASGMWSAVMQMAQGTTCTPGQSMTFAMGVGKRHVRHMRRSHGGHLI